MSLKHESIIELMDLKRTNEKVIAAIHKTGNGDCPYGRKLIKDYKDGIRAINAEIRRRKAGESEVQRG